MPYSYGKFKYEVRDKIKSIFNPETEILDVGAGSGVYSDLLWDTHKNLDALEIFPNYIQMFELEKRYRSVIQADINHFNFDGYELLIMGDMPDLTPEIMLERYPDLSFLYGDENYGYYGNHRFN